MAEDEDKTSQPDEKNEAGRRAAKRPRTPVTIDLEASVVANRAAGAEAAAPDMAEPGPSGQAPGKEEPPPSRPAPPRAVAPTSGNWVGLFAAGLVGALIAILFGYGLLASGLAPLGDDDRLQALAGKDDGLVAALGRAETRIAGLESKVAGPSADAGRIDSALGRLDGLVAEDKALAARLDKLEGALAALPVPVEPQGLASTSELLDDVIARLDRLESGTGGAGPAALGDRLSTLETRSALLSGRVDALADQLGVLAERPAAAESDKAARALAIATLQQGAAKGGGFASELAMIAALSPAAPELAPLRPLAEKGAPSVAEVAAAFPATGEAILKAAASPGASGGVSERLMSRLRGLVTVRPIGPIAGPSPEAVVSRMQAAVDEGDLVAALRERDGLDEAGKAASAVWAKNAAERIAIDDLVGRLVAAVGVPADGQ